MKYLIFTIILISFISCKDTPTTDDTTPSDPISDQDNDEPADPNVLFTDSFNTNGIVAAPWQTNGLNDPKLVVSSGKLVADADPNAWRGAEVSTLSLTNSHMEIDVEFTTPTPSDNTQIIISPRHTATPASAYCAFRVNNGFIETSFHFNGTTSSWVTSSVDTTTSQHKLGCRLSASGDDVIIWSYIDYFSSYTSYEWFMGANSGLPSGAPMVKLKGDAALDNFKIYQNFPYDES